MPFDTHRRKRVKTNILPHLIWCSIVWHFIRSLDKWNLERLQEKVLRTVILDKSSSYEELLNNAKFATANNQRLQNIAFLMSKVKHGICPTYISDPFNLQTTQYSPRSSEFVIPGLNTVIDGKHSIKYLGLTVWHCLPQGKRNASTLSQLRN